MAEAVPMEVDPPKTVLLIGEVLEFYQARNKQDSRPTIAMALLESLNIVRPEDDITKKEFDNAKNFIQRRLRTMIEKYKSNSYFFSAKEKAAAINDLFF